MRSKAEGLRPRPSMGFVSWSKREFEGIDFGDARLNQRFFQTFSQLSLSPQASINQACHGWNETKGSYRLFANPKFTQDELLEKHIHSTLKRALNYKQVFVIQDKSVFDYGSHKKTLGLGPIAGSKLSYVQGILMHSSLCVGNDGVSLGLLSQDFWTRGEGSGNPLSHSQKESSFWKDSLQKTMKLFKGSKTEVILLADREADLNDLLAEACDLESGFVIRGRTNRKSNEGSHLDDFLAAQPCVHKYKIEVAIKGSRTASRKIAERTAKVGVHFGRLEIANKKLKDKEIYGVLVREIDPPESVQEPVQWILLTNVPVETKHDALERISWYKQRWHIENFHRVLKSGCTVEKCRLQTEERLEKYLTLMSVIACRLYWLTHLARNQPNLECTTVFSEAEWKALYIHRFGKANLPNKPPSVRDAVRSMATLGGFLGRKADGEPGVITTWRGFSQVQTLASMYEAMTCG